MPPKPRARSKQKTVRRGIRYCVFTSVRGVELVAHFQDTPQGRVEAARRLATMPPEGAWIDRTEITWKE